jgi:hypothetical protein
VETRAFVNGGVGHKEISSQGGIDRHAVLIEGYDLEQDVAISLNPWSARTEQRFNVRRAELHEFRTTKVFFTVDNIREKKVQIFCPVCDEFLGRLDG